MRWQEKQIFETRAEIWEDSRNKKTISLEHTNSDLSRINRFAEFKGKLQNSQIQKTVKWQNGKTVKWQIVKRSIFSIWRQCHPKFLETLSAVCDAMWPKTLFEDLIIFIMQASHSGLNFWQKSEFRLRPKLDWKDWFLCKSLNFGYFQHPSMSISGAASEFLKKIPN